MTWNPATYLTFETQRTRPVADLLMHLPSIKAQYIMDLGCGPGNSTKLLAQRWPEASIEGLDNSKEMLAEASKLDIKIDWLLNDISGWEPHKSYDLIFANASLQWVPNQLVLLPKLMSYLAQDGYLAFQVPQNFNEPSHTLIQQVLQEKNINLKQSRWWHIHEAKSYYEILENCASFIEIWETQYWQVLEGTDPVYTWMSGTGLRPFLKAIHSIEEKEEFIAEYKKRLKIAYPIQKNGKTLFPFKRLFAIAKKA